MAYVNPVDTSILNAPPNIADIGRQIQAQQAAIGMNQAQTADIDQQIGLRGRTMQMQILSGILNQRDPAQQQAMMKMLIPLANQANPSSPINPNASVDDIRALVMSGVPIAEQPKYNFYQSMVNGAQPANAAPSAPSAPSAAAATAPSASPSLPDSNQVMTPQPAGLTPNQQIGLAVFDPQASQALTGAQRLQLENSPEQQAALAKAKNLGEESGKQTGAALTSGQMYEKLYQNLEAMKGLNKDVPDGLGIPPDWKAMLDTRTGLHPEAAGALAQWDQLNHAGILNGLQQLIATSAAGSSIRSNQTIVRLLETGQGIPADLPRSQRIALINNLEAELKNTQTSSKNVASALSGGQTEPMGKIPAGVGKGVPTANIGNAVMKLQKAGYSQDQINQYLQSKGILNAAGSQ